MMTFILRNNLKNCKMNISSKINMLNLETANKCYIERVHLQLN